MPLRPRPKRGRCRQVARPAPTRLCKPPPGPLGTYPPDAVTPNPQFQARHPQSSGNPAPSTLNSQPSTTSTDTRLIERWLPIAEIGIESLRERTPMTPFPAPNRLHVWWARRPLVASRAAILASPLPADADHEKFNHVLGIHGDPITPKVRIARLANRQRLAESGGPAGKGRYYRLTQDAYTQLGNALAYHVDSRLTQENLKGRVLTALKKGSLTNSDLREITQLERTQAWRLMNELRAEGLVTSSGRGRFVRWRLTSDGTR